MTVLGAVIWPLSHILPCSFRPFVIIYTIHNLKAVQKQTPALDSIYYFASINWGDVCMGRWKKKSDIIEECVH